MGRAMSGVVATLAIVSVAVILSVGTFFFLSGFTISSPEMLDIRIISICTDVIDILIRNKGSSDVEIEEVMVIQNGEVMATLASNIMLSPGQQTRIVAPSGASGDTCQIMVVTRNGNIYMAEVRVP